MSAAPKRIQRKRTKGWRMPEGAVYVGRPTRWGNPFFVHSAEIVLLDGALDSYYVPGGRAREVAVELYREHTVVRRLDPSELRGHDLVCWCPLDQPCHADVLLELANREAR